MYFYFYLRRNIGKILQVHDFRTGYSRILRLCRHCLENFPERNFDQFHCSWYFYRRVHPYFQNSAAKSRIRSADTLDNLVGSLSHYFHQHTSAKWRAYSADSSVSAACRPWLYSRYFFKIKNPPVKIAGGFDFLYVFVYNSSKGNDENN